MLDKKPLPRTALDLSRFQHKAQPLRTMKSVGATLKDENEEAKRVLAERALNSSHRGTSKQSDPSEVRNKQESTQAILEEIKKYLDRQELPKLLGVFREVKDCESIEPSFKKLKGIFFGNIVAPSRSSDRHYREKVQCLSSLATLIPKKNQEEYRSLLHSSFSDA